MGWIKGIIKFFIWFDKSIENPNFVMMIACFGFALFCFILLLKDLIKGCPCH